MHPVPTKRPPDVEVTELDAHCAKAGKAPKTPTAAANAAANARPRSFPRSHARCRSGDPIPRPTHAYSGRATGARSRRSPRLCFMSTPTRHNIAEDDTPNSTSFDGKLNPTQPDVAISRGCCVLATPGRAAPDWSPMPASGRSEPIGFGSRPARRRPRSNWPRTRRWPDADACGGAVPPVRSEKRTRHLYSPALQCRLCLRWSTPAGIRPMG